MSSRNAGRTAIILITDTTYEYTATSVDYRPHTGLYVPAVEYSRNICFLL